MQAGFRSGIRGGYRQIILTFVRERVPPPEQRVMPGIEVMMIKAMI